MQSTEDMRNSRITYDGEALVNDWGVIGYCGSSSAIAIIAQLDKRDKTIVDLQSNITTLAGEMFSEWAQSLLANLDDEKEKNKYLDIACGNYHKIMNADETKIADLQAEIEHLQETIKQGTDALEAARIRLDVCGG